MEREKKRGNAALATNLFCKTFTGRAICLRKRNAEAAVRQIERTYGLSVSPGTQARVIYFLNQLRISVCRARGVVLRETAGWQFRTREPAVLACVRKEGEKIGNTNGIGGA